MAILNPYSKTTYVDGTAPDLNAINLNKNEQGIYDVTEKVRELAAYETNAAASATAAANSASSALNSANSAAASVAVYTDLVEDVANLETKNGFKTSTIPSTTTTKTMVETWELGAIFGDGSLAVSTTRIRINRAVRMKSGTKIALANANYLFSVSIYSLDGVFQSQIPYQSAEYTFAFDCKAIIVVRKTDNADLTSLIAEASASVVISLSSENVGGIVPKNKYMHFSFDDTIALFLDLTTNSATYDSIFDNAFLAGLKTLHDNYGAIFSLYCYGTNGSGFWLEECTDKFASEFRQNSDWLKFGFHGVGGNDYNAVSTAVAQTHYEQVVNELYRICGGFEAIDLCPRIHFYSGSLLAIKAWRSCKNGIVGLLSADDTRVSYSMSADNVSYLQKHDKLYDYTTDLTFISTDVRLEFFMNLSDELEKRYNDIDYASRNNILIIFTHEWQDFATSIAKFTECCQFARDYGYIFEFPQNLI